MTVEASAAMFERVVGDDTPFTAKLLCSQGLLDVEKERPGFMEGVVERLDLSRSVAVCHT